MCSLCMRAFKHWLLFRRSLMTESICPWLAVTWEAFAVGKWAHPSKLTCVIVEGRERPGDSHQQLSFSHHISLCASWNDNNFRIEISILKSSCRACVCVCASLPTCRKILSINWNREMIRLNATLSGLKINHYEMRYTFEYEEASSMSFESWYSSHQKFFCEEIQSFFLNGKLWEFPDV